MFKVGDTVTPIENLGRMGDRVKKGAVYLVIEVDQDGDILLHTDLVKPCWNKTYFSLFPTTKLEKLIYNLSISDQIPMRLYEEE